MCQYYYSNLVSSNSNPVSSSLSNLSAIALVIATIGLAYFTFKLWLSTNKYADEAKKANEINSESNIEAKKANAINLLNNLLLFKKNIEDIYINKVKTKSLEYIVEFYSQEEKELDQESINKKIDPIINPMKVPYDRLLTTLDQIITSVNTQFNIHLDKPWSYLQDEDLLTKNELKSNMITLAKIYMKQGHFIKEQISLIDKLILEIGENQKKAKLSPSDHINLANTKANLIIKKYDFAKILNETYIEGIKEINNF